MIQEFFEMQEIPVQNGQLLHKLSSVEGEGLGEAWEGFFMNPSQVRALGEIPDRHAAGELLQAGRTWNGAGWNTGKASRELHRLTGVPLVSGMFSHYMGAFLYSLALWFGIDVDTLDLSERAAEAAFALAQVYQEGAAQQSTTSRPLLDECKEITPQESDFAMEWAEPEEQLAPELLFLFHAVGKGDRKLELREVLQYFPRFGDLPSRPPENNHRGGSASYLDKEHKAQQQAILHGLRMTRAVYMGLNAGMEQETIQIWLKQLFQHWLEQYYKMLKLRKESSIPGSVAPHDAAGVLFEKEDLQQAKLVQTVNFATGNKFKGFIKNDSYKWGKFNAPKGGPISVLGSPSVWRYFHLPRCLVRL